ncbi:MAG TPA: Ldh family oxidoreductase [Candidatus Paceibacterota bacterium]|nr:Ldh family oxidoreductase [Candidatus Paceibacterota bacterium]
MKIKIEELRQLMVKILAGKYYSQEEAEKIAEVFLYAELSGKNTQGVLKLLGSEPAQNIQPKYLPKIIKETKVSALVDGGGAAGPLAAQFALDKAISLAKETGVGIVGLNNTFSSVGVMGFYARKMAQANLISIVSASSPRAIVPAGGIEPAFGTNPIAFGFPTEEYPIVFDMASSAITWYGLVRAKALGQKLPENVAIDKEGNITTDPEAAMAGAILPFDRSYKGSGLAMVVELLAGAFTGASVVFDEGDWGTSFIAFSPDLVIGTEQFKKKSSELVKKVKAGKTKAGESIHIAGYDSEAKLKEINDSGEIEIEDKILDQLKTL